MILIGIGSNLPRTACGTPLGACRAALSALSAAGVGIEAVSRWYESEPVPSSEQPWYVNGVARLSAALAPGDLLGVLHRIEVDLGRVRSVKNAARVIDLDLLDVDGTVSGHGAWPVLPHPRMTERAFVLHPLRDVAPDWRHPVTGRDIDDLIGRLPATQRIQLLAEG